MQLLENVKVKSKINEVKKDTIIGQPHKHVYNQIM